MALGVVGVGAFLLHTLQKAAAAGTLKVFIDNIHVECGGFLCTSPVVQLVTVIQNPSTSDLKLTAVAGDVFLNGGYIGNASSFNIPPIKAGAQQPVNISVRLQIAQVAATLLDLVTGKQGLKGEIRFDGTVTGEGVNIPLNLTYKVL